jgi:hypothetical protein
MKFRLMILEVCGLFLFCMNMQGQYRVESAVQNNRCLLTGNLQYDLLTDINGYNSADSSAANSKVLYKRLYSPLWAGLFSAVIPGAGQFYTRNYLKGSLFLGAEVLLWVLYTTYEKKGDDKTNFFQNYADENWSVVRYAAWINANFGQAIAINNADPNLLSWERVHWDELNTVEEAIAGDLTIQPTGFTHKLAPHGDQQYYEMIGKYSQFGGGWGDASWFTKADVLANNGIGNVSPQFLAYSKMRGDANDFYNIASTVSYVVVANHVLSALEAAWNASKLNHRIKLQGHIESRKIYGNLVEFVPTLHVEYEL